MSQRPADNPLLRDPITHGLWAHSALPVETAGPLAADMTTDVIVVGGGFTGLAAALRLAEQGAEVTLLEARDIGYGASGRNVGLVNAGLWMSPSEIVQRLGDDHGERLMTLLGDAPARVFELIERHGIDCEASRAGTLHCAHSAAGYADLRRRAADWSERGAPVELLDRHHARDRIGSEYFHGALLDHRAGTVQPLGYARGLARAAAQAGARIHVQSPVRALNHRNGYWRAETAGGTVSGRSVILATNAYTEGVMPIADCIVPFSFFQLATPPLPERVRETILPEGQGAWDTAKILTSLRLDAEGRLIAGSIGRLDARRRGIHAQWLRRKVRQVFPQIGEVRFNEGWHGTIATTGDHLPRMARPESGLITAYGYNGRGIGTGTVFGEVMADYALNEREQDLPLPLTDMKPEPLRALRAAGIELGVRAYHLIANRF